MLEYLAPASTVGTERLRVVADRMAAGSAQGSTRWALPSKVANRAAHRLAVVAGVEVTTSRPAMIWLGDYTVGVA